MYELHFTFRNKLIERGIPESEVKFIHEADTDMKKKELFQKTRKGEVLSLIHIYSIFPMVEKSRLLFVMDTQQTECASILMTTICMSEIAAIIYALSLIHI